MAFIETRHLLLGRKVMTNLDGILKNRDITLSTKVHLVKAMVFPVPGSGRSGEGNGCPLQYFCQDNPKDRGAWQATVHGVTNLDMTEQLSYYHSVIWRSLSQLWLYRRPSTSFWLVLCKNCSTCRLFLTCFGGSWAPCPPTLPPGSFFILKF